MKLIQDMKEDKTSQVNWTLQTDDVNMSSSLQLSSPRPSHINCPWFLQQNNSRSILPYSNCQLNQYMTHWYSLIILSFFPMYTQQLDFVAIMQT